MAVRDLLLLAAAESAMVPCPANSGAGESGFAAAEGATGPRKRSGKRTASERDLWKAGSPPSQAVRRTDGVRP